MTESVLERNPLVRSQHNMDAYFQTHDIQYVAEDAVFINMNNGEKTHGREAIAGMLHFIYQVAFDAKAEIVNTIVTEKKALLEARFTGRHIGEIAGISPTGNQVDVPLIVSYDLANGLIKTARIYMLESVLEKQLAAEIRK